MKPFSFSLYFSDPWSKFNSHKSLAALLNGLRAKIADKLPYLSVPFMTERIENEEIEEGFSGIILSLKAYVGGHSYAAIRKIRIDFWQKDETTTDINRKYLCQILEELLPEECIYKDPSPNNLIA